MDVEDIVDGGLEDNFRSPLRIANDEVIEHAFSTPAELRISNNMFKY